MIGLPFDYLPTRIRDSYARCLTSVIRAGADRPSRAERPPNEFYVYLKNGSADIWRWPSDEHAGGWEKRESFQWRPMDRMRMRIVDIFFRTWDVIGADIADSYRSEGSKRALAVLRKGVLSKAEAWGCIVDHVDRYHGDDEAFNIFEHWLQADHTSCKNVITRELKGVGF